MLMFFKHFGLVYLPMAIGFLFSPEDFLAPLHFFAFSDKLLSGRAKLIMFY